MQVKQIQIKAKVTPHNTKQVAEAMAALGDLIRQFKEINTQEGIDEHVARINGYAYALVNMDVIAEETWIDTYQDWLEELAQMPEKERAVEFNIMSDEMRRRVLLYFDRRNKG